MKSAVLGLFLICSAVSSLAQLPEGELRGYSMRLWGADDGLPNQRIQAFAQTHDGLLWIGTQGGLLSFDGANFTVYDGKNAPLLRQRAVNCLVVTRDGSLWIGTEGGGVVRYAHGRFVSYPSGDGLANQFVRAIHEDRTGRIWVGANEGIFQVDGARLHQIDNRNGVPQVFVRAIAEGGNGNTWVGGTALLEFHENKLVHQFPLPGGFSLNFVTAMCAAQDGTLWVGTLTGLHRLSSSGILQRLPGIHTEVSHLNQTSDGRLWIGTIGEGLFDYSGAGLRIVSPGDLPSTTIEAAFQDHDGNLWLGTRAGVVRLSRTPVNIVSLPGNTDSQFESLYGDVNGSIWVVTSSNLFQIQNETAIPYRMPGLPDLRLRTLLRDRAGTYWLGTDGSGLIHLDGVRSRQFSYGHGLSNNFVTAILQDRDGSIWAGTDGGLNHVSSKGSITFDTENGLPYYRITALLEDRNGDVWVGTSRGLSRISGGRVVQDAATRAMQQEQLWSIYQDPRGGVWFGTSDGLYGLRDGKITHITADEGLQSNTIYQILDDRHGNIWLSSPNSIARLSVADLAGYSQSARLKLTLYLSSHDLASTSLYGGIQPSGAAVSNGDVWFPSTKGAVHIAVSRIVSKQLLPVVIEQISAEGRVLPLGSPVKLMAGNSRFEISYAAIHLGPQEGIRYSFKMEGLEQWSAPSEQRTAYYTHIPAGSYVFRVRAFAIDNPDGVSEASVVVEQEPHFYATPWFLVCCGVAALAVALLIYRLRIHQMRMRFKAVSEERARLAREMHDTIIQGCVGVSTLLEAALGVEPSEESLRVQLLTYASDQVSATIEAARESVWALRNSSESNADIGSLSEGMVREFQATSSIPIESRVSGEPFLLGDSATHELMMAIRESVSNAVVHASATCIHLEVAFADADLKIAIRDDGRGFELNAAKSQKGHFGIIGMQERIALLGGELTIVSELAHGTVVSIVVPRRSRLAERKQTVHAH